MVKSMTTASTKIKTEDLDIEVRRENETAKVYITPRFLPDIEYRPVEWEIGLSKEGVRFQEHLRFEGNPISLDFASTESRDSAKRLLATDLSERTSVLSACTQLLRAINEEIPVGP